MILFSADKMSGIVNRLLGFATGIFLLAPAVVAQTAATPQNSPAPVPGFRDYAQQLQIDKAFLAVLDAKLAGEELKTLTAAPHMAGSKEDYATAQYVAKKFREDGFDTHIVTYRVLMNLPRKIEVSAYDANGRRLMSGPTREHVSDDPQQDDPRIVTAFNEYSPSGDVTAQAVYANYGRPEDFAYLEAHHVSVRGKIVLVRYGENFRGVKVYLAQQHGAAGVLIYSDPADDGYFRGDVYPEGPYRPPAAVQRGSVQYLFKYAGDPTTPGFASTENLPAARRVSMKDAASMPSIPSTPLSYQDAAPILKALAGPETPRNWQGALPFTYHLGPGPVKIHMKLQQEYALRPIWNVIGKVPGTAYPEDWVIVGNHRDAWVYGAVDPGSGTAAVLEAAHGVGALLRQNWKPKRTIVFASWDAEEEGLLGSTEWGEQNAAQLAHAVAYLNIDIGVDGPNFEAGSVPSLKPMLAELTKLVPSPQGGTVYAAWLRQQQSKAKNKTCAPCAPSDSETAEPLKVAGLSMDNLGSGSDYTVFLQHLGVPSNYISSSGPYGVYHSTFDDYAWFTKFADPDFQYLQETARVLGLQAITLADADLVPYDYAVYGEDVVLYIQAAQQKALAAGMKGLDFAPALAAAKQFEKAGEKAMAAQKDPHGDLAQQNRLLRQAEDDFLAPSGLPARPWYKHVIYAPGMYTGYAAVMIPGVNEAIDARNMALTAQQLTVLTDALNRAAATLNKMP